MTFRVNRACSGGAVVLTLSGDIAGDHSAELQVLVGAELNQRLILDLGEASVIDRAGVLLLARAEADGATLANCPAYVREWVERERDTSARTQNNVRGGEHGMTQVAKTANEGMFQASDGLRIFFRWWLPANEARATVTIVPGFNSHSGYYTWVADRLTAVGVAVFAVDLRGRGKSVVVSGLWYFGYGPKNEQALVKALPPGAFYTEPARESHFARTGPEGATVSITGYGPTDTIYAK